MTTTLLALLASNQTLLGQNFENLGMKKGILLSYDRTKGWAIERLDGVCGFFKWIFRCLGFYQSTRLVTIKTQIDKEPLVNQQLRQKIGLCWMKKEGHDETGPNPPLNEPQMQVNPPPGQNATRINGTLFTFVQGDITQVRDVKAIVNAANEQCLGGGGVDGAIQAAAGPQLYQECLRLPVTQGNVRCPTGEARITGSGNLAALGIERVIHTVGPVYSPQNPEASKAALRSAYINSLELARANGIRSIAFPSISTGVYGYDFNAATQVAYETIQHYLNQHPGWFNQVKIVYFDQMSYVSAIPVWDAFQFPPA